MGRLRTHNKRAKRALRRQYRWKDWFKMFFEDGLPTANAIIVDDTSKIKPNGEALVSFTYLEWEDELDGYDAI